MSKKKNDDKSVDKQLEKKDDSLDTSSLTPWQKENLEYLKTQGDSPSWQPSLVEDKDTGAEKNEAPEKTDDIEEIIESKKELNERKRGKWRNNPPRTIAFSFNNNCGIYLEIDQLV